MSSGDTDNDDDEETFIELVQQIIEEDRDLLDRLSSNTENDND